MDLQSRKSLPSFPTRMEPGTLGWRHSQEGPALGGALVQEEHPLWGSEVWGVGSLCKACNPGLIVSGPQFHQFREQQSVCMGLGHCPLCSPPSSQVPLHSCSQGVPAQTTARPPSSCRQEVKDCHKALCLASAVVCEQFWDT